MQTSVCSLDKEKTIICAALLLEVMAIHNNIFVEDIVQLRQDKAKVLALDLPHKLNIKESALEFPIFTQRRARQKDFVPVVIDKSIVPAASTTPAPSKPTLTQSQRAQLDCQNRVVITDPSQIETERYSAPMTISTMTYIIAKIRALLGWKCTWNHSF